jgi:hypothetical protein
MAGIRRVNRIRLAQLRHTGDGWGAISMRCLWPPADRAALRQIKLPEVKLRQVEKGRGKKTCGAKTCGAKTCGAVTAGE